MARQLWLLRHADAEPHGTRADSERELTPRGERQARLAGIALARLAVNFAAVLTSPKVRARQTAELALSEWGPEDRDLLQTYPPLAGGFDARLALETLEGTDDDARVLLVGHEPDLSGVLAALSGALVDLKKGGLAALRLQGAGGELVLLLRPRELAFIAGQGDADV